MLNEWDAILGGNAKNGCWHEKVCFSNRTKREYPPIPDRLKAGAQNKTYEAVVLGEALDVVMGQIDRVTSIA